MDVTEAPSATMATIRAGSKDFFVSFSSLIADTSTALSFSRSFTTVVVEYGLGAS